MLIDRINNLQKQLNSLESYIDAGLTLEDVVLVTAKEIKRLEKLSEEIHQ